MAQGGSFVAVAHGYNALFYNPAGFAEKGGSFTLASANPWLFLRPDLLIDYLESDPFSGGFDLGVLGGLLEMITEQLTTTGLGVGTSAGIGIVGMGVGLGVVMTVDSYLHGTLLGAEGDLTATFGFIGGGAIPINLLGINFKFGASIKPMIRVRVPLSADIFTGLFGGGVDGPADILNSVDAYHGFGLGVDLGASMELGPLNIALSVRDFGGTRFFYSRSSLGQLVEGFQNGTGFPEGDPLPEDVKYVIPMNMSAGIAFRPDLGGLQRFLNPVIHADLQDVIGVIRDKKSPWTLLHMGAEITLLSFINLRAGLNQGYVTLGGGVKLLFLDVNFAVFTRELGKNLGDQPNSGVTLEAALRF